VSDFAGGAYRGRRTVGEKAVAGIVVGHSTILQTTHGLNTYSTHIKLDPYAVILSFLWPLRDLGIGSNQASGRWARVVNFRAFPETSSSSPITAASIAEDFSSDASGSQAS
jgi:hypothetical protein